LNLQNN